MPVGMEYDIQLKGKGFMLARGLPGGGRAWTRTGAADSASQRLSEDARFGNLPDEIDHPEVFSDWSGGYGDAYRTPSRRNTYHWSENFDPRWPQQLVHAQRPRLMEDVTAFGPGNTNVDINYIADIPPITASDSLAGRVAVFLLGRNWAFAMEPYGSSGQLTRAPNAHNFTQTYGNRTAVFGSFVMLPILDGSLFLIQNIDSGVIPVGSTNDFIGFGRAFTTAGNRLWRLFGAANRGQYLSSIPSGVHPRGSGNWSATLSVGDGVSDVTDLIALGDQVFAGAGDGLYAGDQSGTFYNLLSEVASQRHLDNCRDLTIYQGRVHAQTVGGVWSVLPSSDSVHRAEVREVGPQPLSNQGPVRGYVRALRAQGPWLHAGLWTGSQSHLLAGIDASPGLPYVWHTMQRLPHVAKIHRVHVDGGTVDVFGTLPVSNRMWVATDASVALGGTAPVYLWPVPAQNGNPLAGDPAFVPTYAGSARMDFPATNWGVPATPKVWRSMEVWNENLAPSVAWCNVYYTVDKGTRTLLGTAASAPLTRLYFPTEDAGGSFVLGQSIAVSIESFTASAAITPVYRSFVLRGALNPKSVDVITAVLRAADNVPNRIGTPMRPAATMLQELRDIAKGPPVTMVDTTGASQIVKVLQPITEQEVYQAGSDDPEIAATVRMAVLTFSGP